MMKQQSQSPANLTAEEALRALESRLREAGIENAGTEGRHALAHVLGCTPLGMRAERRRALSEPETRHLEDVARRLADHEPLAYIVGDVDFRGHLIRVDRRVLVPRPETEELVQAVLDQVDLWEAPVVQLADAGTGSGCIAVSLALEQPRARVIAVDASPGAVDVARTNVRAHGVQDRVDVRCGKWLEGIRPGSLQAVVSNPPYVSAAEFEALAPGVRTYEPAAALVGGRDGLQAFRALVPDAWNALAPGGFLFMEIGADQADSVLSRVAATGFCDVGCRLDMQGKDRIIFARRP